MKKMIMFIVTYYVKHKHSKIDKASEEYIKKYMTAILAHSGKLSI